MSYDKELRLDVNQALKAILKKVNKNSPERQYGICALVQRNVYYSPHYSRAIALLKDLWMYWPEYSGDRSYPVPNKNLAFPRKGVESEACGAFLQSSFTCSLWDGEYGESRKRLLQWLIEQTDKPIEGLTWDGLPF